VTRQEFQDRIARSILLFDGAMGTMLYSRGVFINRCYDELNISSPDIVKSIHEEYVAAGAKCIETNTFGANRFKLRNHGYGEQLVAINEAGARIARAAAGSDVLVAGSIGPLGVRLEPFGPLSEQDAFDSFREQAEALASGGADLFILETFSDLHEISKGVAAIRSIGDFPIIASMTVHDDGNTVYGTTAEQIASGLDGIDVDVIGLNCSVGPPAMLGAMERIIQISEKPLSVMPNAGVPRMVEGRNIYLASKEYMAAYARRFIQAGARIVGGCCGTTPEYIRGMRNFIAAIQPQTHPQIHPPREVAGVVIRPVPREEKSELAARLSEGAFVTSVEITPPRGCDPSKVIAAAKTLRENGVCAVNVPDGPRALSRMGAQHLSVLIRSEAGIEPVLHYSCRDRNLLGMMSDMLGLQALGIRNLLIVTGDPPKMGDYPDATAVFDVDSIGLTRMVHTLNQGYDLAGNPIGAPTSFHIGVGLDPGAIELEREIERFHQKVEAGAEFAITQPVFDLEILERFLTRIGGSPIPIVAGVWPLVSLRNAEFMNNEVPGASVPEEIMSRMRAADSKERALEEGISIARDAVRLLRGRVQGVQVSAPFGNVRHSLKVLEALK